MWLIWLLVSVLSWMISIAIFKVMSYGNCPVSSVVTHITISAGGLGFDSLAGQIDTVSPTARYRCDVSSELFCPGASHEDEPRR